MSAQDFSPARNRLSRYTGNPFLEIVRLTPEWKEGLQQFLHDIKAGGEDVFFYPHAADTDVIFRLASRDNKDLHYLIVEQGKVLGYGLLRGWGEGYLIPSLGLAIHPLERGHGLGMMLMDFLHLLAARRGADIVRLRVRENNEKALNLYKNLGYFFEKDADQDCFLVGFKKMGRKL